MAHPFPERPITLDVIAQITPGWKSCNCPLCDEPAAGMQVENKNVGRYICPTCQRFLLSGPQKAALTNNPARKLELSKQAAASEDIAEFI